MNQVVKTILALVIAGAITSNAAVLFQFEGRLARIEAQLDFLTAHNFAVK